jgi:hypothetical protein
MGGGLGRRIIGRGQDRRAKDVQSGSPTRPRRILQPDCGPVPVGRRPVGILRTVVSSQSVRGEVDCDSGSSGGVRIDTLRRCKPGRPPRPRRGGWPDCGPVPHPTRPAGLLRTDVSSQSVRGEVGCDAGSSGGSRTDTLRRCKAGHQPRPGGVGGRIVAPSRWGGGP